MAETDLELRDEIKELVGKKKFDQLDELWLGVVEGSNQPEDFHDWLARYLQRRQLPDKLKALYTILLDARLEQKRPEQVLLICRVLLTVDPQLDFLRPYLMKSLDHVYGDRETAQREQCYRVSGLKGDAPDLLKALTRFMDLIGAAKGQVFRHRQWGLGIVRELDARADHAVLDFPQKPNHKMTIAGIKNFLERIPDDHILARMAREPELFKAHAMEEPAAVVKLALRSSGGKMKAQDLKRLFMNDGGFSEADYKKWWPKARDEIRLDPYIDLAGAGANQTLVLRKEPRSFMDEVITRLIAAKDAPTFRNALRDMAKHGDITEMSPQDIEALKGCFLHPVQNNILKDRSARLAHGLLFEEFRELFPADLPNPIDVDQIINEAKDPVELIRGIEIWELQKIALERIIALRPNDEARIMSELFLYAEPRLAQWMDRTLHNQGQEDARLHGLERILAAPERNPDLFVWAARNLLAGNSPKGLTDLRRPIVVCEQLASMTARNLDKSELGSGEAAAEAKAAAFKFKGVMQENQFKNMRAALRASTEDEARRFLGAISMMGGLPGSFRSQLEQLVLDIHKGLKGSVRGAEAQAAAAAPKNHYVTQEAVDAKRRELSQIRQVDIPENSKAIGIARELGDLKENAEYHAAKDRQKLLAARSMELEELLSQAVVIDPANIRADQVRFGTRVTLERVENKTQEVYTILGMWEADPNQGVISYQTPLGSQLLNKKPDEEVLVKLPGGQEVLYRILSVEKAI